MSDIKTIATLARDMKASKKQVFEMLMERIEQDGQIYLGDNDAAMLYKYFSPAIPAKPKTPEQWVARAMGQTDVRFYLNNVYCDGARLMAADGHRLHVHAGSGKYSAGYYDSNMNPIEVDARFPDVDRVIPDMKQRPKTVHFDDLVPLTVEGVKPWNSVYNLPDNGPRVCAKYLQDAAAGFADPVIRYDGPNDNVAICDAFQVAVVMPMKR